MVILSCGLPDVLKDAHEDIPRIQVSSILDTGLRRRFSDDEKLRIVEESSRDAGHDCLLYSFRCGCHAAPPSDRFPP